MKAKYIIVLLGIFSGSLLFGQKNFSLYHLKGIPQAVYVNPSFVPKSKIYLSLPLGMMNFGVSNSGFSFNDLFTKRSDDSLVINTQKVLEEMDDLNYFNVENSIELFGLGLKLKDMYINFNVSSKVQANFIYPKGLFQFALEGNGKNFIGQRASLDGIGINLNAYTEIGFGISKEISDKLSVGGRVKLLSGIANITTRETRLGIYTDPTTYALTIDGFADISSSNISQFYDDTISSSQTKMKNLQSSILNFANKGFGLDLGATYKVSDKLSVNASLVDLGSIRWSNNVTSYKTNEFEFTFEGVDLNEYFSEQENDSSGNRMLDDLKDSIPKMFNYEENNEAYSTSLYTKFYIGANYEITKAFNVGGVIINEFVKGKYRPGVSLAANVSLKSWLSATLNYSIYNKTYSNIGVGLSLRGGPIQFYLMTDNVLAFTNTLNAKNVNLTGGMSIFIKERDKKKKEKTEVEGGGTNNNTPDKK
ncbi:MAG: Sporulation protein [Crocinitomicaceae bacterium]|jgi:hypothetical protein|nr:Sporulation protein [Crocinitomicaceae bacterium]